MTSAERNIAAAMSFVRAVEQMDGSLMDEFFAKHVEQVEWPNQLKPEGARRDLAALKTGIEQARGILRHQSYEIKRQLADDQSVMLEMVWRGTMATDVPPLKKDQELCAHCVAVFEFRDGQIVALRNYDCFDPIENN